MARHDDRQQSGKFSAQLFVHGDDGWLFARMGRGGHDYRALADDLSQLMQSFLVGRRRRHVELEISGGDDARRAELGIALGVGGLLSQTQIEAIE